MERLSLALVMVLSLLAGCTASYHEHPFPQETGAATTGAPLTCGAPTALVKDPLQVGAVTPLTPLALRLGPLWLRGFVPGATTATIPGPPSENLLTKVLIEHVRGTGMVLVTGASCATGVPLRFCYGPCGDSVVPGSMVPPPAATLQVSIDLRSSGYSGYMLFPAPGAYRLSAERAGRSVGSVVVVRVRR